MSRGSSKPVIPIYQASPVKVSQLNTEEVQGKPSSCQGGPICEAFRDSSSSLCMPGEHDEKYISSLTPALISKHSSYSITDTWIASPDLYSLWRYTSSVIVELFADCFNESGVLDMFCSSDSLDDAFGSIGEWQSQGKSSEGGAANPPFEAGIIQEILLSFENGVRSPLPYCRCALLPLGNVYGVLSHMKN